MGLPKVSITLENGQLGLVAGTNDGVAGLVMTGIATASIALGESKQIFSTKQAEDDLLLTAAYDTANTTNVHKTIKDFYAQAGEGKELWVMIVAKTTTMTSMCDTANTILKKLLNDAQGRIRIVGITRVPDGAYSPSYANELDPDVIAAAAKAHALAVEFQGGFKPFRTVLDGRDFQGTLGSILDLRGSAYNTVSVALGTDISGSDNAAVGLVLGRLARNPVQRNIGRVKDGDLGIQTAFLTGQTTDIKDIALASLDALHDKGYIFPRKFQGKNGYYFNDDPTASPASDDYSSFARGRIMDKALTLIYTTYVEEILDDLTIDPTTGRLAAGVIKDYQSKIKSVLDLEMTAKDEISGVNILLDPKQNVLSTNKVVISGKIIPKGYGKEIAFTIGFENPSNA